MSNEKPLYLCPECGFNEIEISGAGLKRADGSSMGTAKCPNCDWSGSIRDTVGVLTTERIWTSERIADLMLRITMKHAAGPMVQAYEYIGLLPRLMEVPTTTPEEILAAREHNELAQGCRDHVMRAIFSTAIEAGFSAAEEAHRLYAVKTNTPLHHVLSEKKPAVREFGGDVVPIIQEPKS